MTKELKWRLGKLPTPDEVLKLVNDKLITKEEARDILFKEEEIKEKDVKSLESEVRFLKEVIEKMGTRTQIIEVTKQILPIYIQQPWYQPYYYWTSGGTTYIASNGSAGGGGGAGICGAGYTTTGTSSYTTTSTDSGTNCSFSAIQTY